MRQLKQQQHRRQGQLQGQCTTQAGKRPHRKGLQAWEDLKHRYVGVKPGAYMQTADAVCRGVSKQGMDTPGRAPPACLPRPQGRTPAGLSHPGRAACTPLTLCHQRLSQVQPLHVSNPSGLHTACAGNRDTSHRLRQNDAQHPGQAHEP